MEITDLPDPQIERDDDVLLKIEAVGVCGSDVHYYETGRIGSQIIEYPFIIGHECSSKTKTVRSVEPSTLYSSTAKAKGLVRS